MIGGKAHKISSFGGSHAGASVYRPGVYVARLANRLSPDRVQEDALPTALASGADARLCAAEAHDHNVGGRLCLVFRRVGSRVLALALSLSLVFGSCFPHYSYAVVGEVIGGLAFGEFAGTYLVPSIMAALFGVSVATAPWYQDNFDSNVDAVFGSEGAAYDWAQGMYANYTASGTGGTFTVDGMPQELMTNTVNWYGANASSLSGVYDTVSVTDSSGTVISNCYWSSNPGFAGYSACFSAASQFLSGDLYYAGCRPSYSGSGALEYVRHIWVNKPLIDVTVSSSGWYHDYYSNSASVQYRVSDGVVQGPYSWNTSGTFDALDPLYLNPSVVNAVGASNPALSQPVVSSVPSSVSSIASGIASGVLSTGEAVGALYDEFTGANVAVGEISPSIPWEDVVTTTDTPVGPDEPVTPDEPIYIPILSDIAQGLADILAWLAAAIFNANVLSFADGALTSLVDAFGLSGLFESVVTAVESLPDAIAWPWTLDDLQGIGNDVIGGVVGGILAGLGIEGGVTFWDQLSGVLSNGIGVDVLGWGDLVGAVTGIGDDVVDFPGILTGIGDDVIGAIHELGDILTGGITVSLDWTLEALRAALEGLGVNVVGLDLTGILDAIAALPAEIAAVLGLDWWIEQADHLRPELPDTDLLVLPQATWDEFMAAFEALAVVRVVNGLKGGMLSFFDTLGGGSHGNSQPPRYDIDFSVLGYPVHFVIDFGVFNQSYVLYAHGFMYCLLLLWLFGFSERVQRWMSSHIASLLGID